MSAKRKNWIEVDGSRYRVVESLGFSHDAGAYAKIVSTPTGERVAIKRAGSFVWHFNTVENRLGGVK